MAISWGSWKYGGGNGMRVGLDVSWSSVSNSSSSATATVKVWVQNQYAYNDPQTMNYSGGSISGSTAYNNVHSNGAPAFLVDTKTYTYSYGSTSYGSSPSTRTFTAQISGAYNGVTPSESVSSAVPARPYANPAAVTGVTESRVSDTKTNLSWTRHASNGAPYSTITIQRQTTDNVWRTVATINGGSSSWVDNAVVANEAYKYQVRANNSKGSSGWSASGWIFTTPAPPSNAKASLQGNGSIKVTWTDTVRYIQHTFDIDRSVAGGAWSGVAVGLSDATTSWTDTSPGAGTNQYRVKTSHWESGNPSQQLISAPATTNTVSTIVPPLAPTLLKPNGVIYDAARTISLSWQHNDGGDGAEQSAYEIRYSSDNGTTWTWLPGGGAKFTGTASSYTLPASTLTNGLTYVWQIRTWGAHATPSAYSASATIITSSTPTVTITAPFSPVTAMPLVAMWDFNQDEGLPQAAWEGRLYSLAGDMLTSSSGTTETAWSIAYPFADGVTYRIDIRARANTLWSDWDRWAVTIDLLPPANVSVSPSFDPGTGWMVLDLHADDPSPDGTLLRTNLATTPRPDPTWASYPAAGDTSAPVGGTITYVPAVIEGAPEITTAWRIEGTGGAAGLYLTGTSTALPETGPVAVSFWVRSSGSVTAAIVVDETTTVVSQPGVFPDWTLVSGSIESASSVTAAAFTSVVGWVEVTGLMVEQTSTVGSYFDGATPDDDSLGSYEWTGTAFSSTSTLTSPGTNSIDHVAVQRRIDGGDWVTIIDDLGFPDGPDQTVLDTTPSLRAVMEYRLIVTSVSPSTLTTEPVSIETFGHRSTVWGFLSYGAGFGTIVRAAGNPGLGDKAERARESKPAAGRQYPILLIGDQRSRVRSVSLLAMWDDVPGTHGPSSTDHEWIEASLEADIVCWRDWRGVRIFGRLDGFACNPQPNDKTAEISFSVEQTDYHEGV